MSSELEGCFLLGEIAEVVEVAERLRDLPEYGRSGDLSSLHSWAQMVSEKEEELRQCKRKFREAAEHLLRSVRNYWTDAEIEEATGYKLT